MITKEPKKFIEELLDSIAGDPRLTAKLFEEIKKDMEERSLTWEEWKQKVKDKTL